MKELPGVTCRRRPRPAAVRFLAPQRPDPAALDNTMHCAGLYGRGNGPTARPVLPMALLRGEKSLDTPAIRPYQTQRWRPLAFLASCGDGA